MSAGSTRTHKIFFTRDDGTSFLGDAIECEGRIWLVPEWIPVDHTAGTLRPARMICVDGRLEETSDPQYRTRLVLIDRLTADFLQGRQTLLGLDVTEAPDLILNEKDLR
jgi:hypothetical protein